MNPVLDVEERQAWDQYVAAVGGAGLPDRRGESPEECVARFAEMADAMLAERRKRFGRGDGK